MFVNITCRPVWDGTFSADFLSILNPDGILFEFDYFLPVFHPYGMWLDGIHFVFYLYSIPAGCGWFWFFEKGLGIRFNIKFIGL